jgi:hypothetical protein
VTGILEKRSSPKAVGEGGQRCSSSTRSRCRRRRRRRGRGRARPRAARASRREVARLKPLAEKRAVGQKEADDAASNAELARAP